MWNSKSIVKAQIFQGENPVNNLKAPFIVAAVCLLVAASSSQAWEGFKMPNLNPFAKKSTTTKYHLSDSRSTRSWVPSLPKVNLLPKRKPGQPSTLGRVGRQAQGIVSKTTSALNPFKKKSQMPPVSPKFTGSRRTYSGSTMASKSDTSKEPNWLIKLLTYEKVDSDKVETTNDFLRLKRPGFDDD